MTLLEALGVRPPEIIALTGAGGKTTIMLQLAREARAIGLRTVITVTTKMFPPEEAEFGPAVYDAASLAGRDQAVYAAGKDQLSGKLLGIDPAAIPEGFDLVLVEADGALHKPLTAPREHEPVIPPLSTTVLAVAGLDALGQPISSMHHPEVISRLTGVAVDEPVTMQVIATVLSDSAGSTKDRPEAARVAYILNKADDELGLQQGKQLAGFLPGPAVVTVEGYVVWPQA